MENLEYLNSLVKELIKLPRESEWVEFKHNNARKAGLICIYDESVGTKARKYIPAWARS